MVKLAKIFSQQKFPALQYTVSNQQIFLHVSCTVVNVGIGTYIFNDDVSYIFLVYIGYVSFMAILPYILRALLKCATAYTCSYSYAPLNVDETVKVTYGSTNAEGGSKVDSTSQREGGALQNPTKPTRDSPIRWVALIIYFGVTTPLIVAMVVLAAAGAINT